MLKTFLDSEEVGNLVLTGWTCTLSPDSLTDYSTAIEAVKRAKEKDPQSLLAHQALAGLLLRAGEYKSALDELQQAKTFGDADGESSAYTDYLLTIAHHWLGDSASAQSALDEANGAAELELNNTSPPATWTRRLTLNLLREEAERTIQADDVPTRNEGDTKK